MGVWGTGVFQNDSADDVKEIYISSLKKGLSDEQAYTYTLSEISDYLCAEETYIDSWLGLASIMNKYGRLNNDAKSHAIKIIDSMNEIDRWSDIDKPKRKRVIENLKKQLLAPQPERRAIKVAKPRVPEIKPNDVYYYFLDGAKPCYIYVLVDSWVTYDLRVKDLGDKLPIIYLKCSKMLLDSKSDIDSLPFLELDVSNLIRNNADDKRILMHPNGFRAFKKEMIFLDNYSFKRDVISQNKIIKPNEWDYKGKHGMWETLNDRIKSVLRE